MNIIEYVVKNGIYDFSKKPFCEVDSLVISQLSYLKFEGIVKGPAGANKGVVLKKIKDHKKYDTIFRDERYRDINSKFFDALCESERFGNLILNNFIDIIDESVDVQFSAMTVEDKKGFKYLVFRGTDDSIIGWKEDLNMTFKTPVPAQEYSVKYLEKISSYWEGNFLVGGHSKGGNLAVYSAMNCRKEIRDRIISIYSHDGPGFRTELIQDSFYKDIQKRIFKYVPKSAVVGLFGNLEDYIVVDCEKHGVKQHNPYNWIIEDFEFKKVDHIGKISSLQAEAINAWSADMTKEQWAMLSDQIFGVFKAADVTNLNDFNEDFFGTLSRVRGAVDKVDDESKDKVRAILSMFKDHATEVAKEDARANMQSAENSFTKAKEATIEKVHNVSQNIKKKDGN